MGTLLSELYGRFMAKVDEDLTGKQSLIFALVDVAIAKSTRHCKSALGYTLDNEPVEEDWLNDYQGSFDFILDTGEIELIALHMLYEWHRRKQSYLIAQRNSVGTSDFNRLPDKANELKSVAFAMKITNEDIVTAQNDLYEYRT